MRPETHAATEAAFHAALWQVAPPPGLAAPDPSEIARRFAVYRNNVQHGLTRALAARFPVVEQLVGAEFFAAMARVFIAGAPPSHPVLLHWGEAFPAFLESFPPVGHLPWLADVARLVHKDLAHTLKYARVWGKSGIPGQHVGREHKLADGDVVELHN